MKDLSIIKKIILIASAPALLLSIILTTYYTSTQISYITDSLNRHGQFIARQLAPGAEYVVFSGNTEFIEPLINSALQNNAVVRIQITDNSGKTVYDSGIREKSSSSNSSFMEKLFGGEEYLVFSESIRPSPLIVGDYENAFDPAPAANNSDSLGRVIVTLTTRYATHEKIQNLKNSISITLAILFVASLLIIWFSQAITRPIQSLTDAVRRITSGKLDTRIEVNATDEIGILQSCINNMTEEIRHYQSDMQQQLDEYTRELQETMEELEIRNAELDITRSKAIHANKAKSEFLANMSHEIRTPLSGIIGFAELLQSTELNSQQKDYSATIHKSARHLLEIINDILDLSKIESGKTEITKSEFRLVDIIEDIIILLSQNALEKNIELFYRIEQDVPEIIQADPFRMHQILMNLIGNAIKFTSDGYVYLQVSMGDLENAETSIKFTVSDTGIGMSSEDKKKLFQAFTQADTTITRRFGGTGLGLVISRKLTLLMNGEIGFDSTKGEGSTFWFTIPVTPVASKQEEAPATKKKIAFFCDHFIARQTYSNLLDSWHYVVSLYNLKDMDSLADIEKEHDAAVVFLGIKNIQDSDTIHFIQQQDFSIPSFLIASTRNLSTLKDLQQHAFYNAVFSSEKIDIIRQKLTNTINRSLGDSEPADNLPLLPEQQDWSDINIMIVDDNEVNLRLVEIFLQNHRAGVTTAHSGTQAIDYARTGVYDIIFMDLHMPGLDGYETTRKIREITPGKQPVIIALTANVMPQEKERVIQAGMNGILLKPVSDAILQKVISQWVYKQPTDSPDFIDNGYTEIVADASSRVFSLASAREFTGNNETLAYELFELLRGELNEHRKAILRAVKQNDMVALHEQVHKLHGASRCCGTLELKEISSHIENLINKNISFDLHQEIDRLLAAIQRVRDFETASEHPE
ncbi:MAG TPA: response regulator [Gammaproteobacteria bacterium]|nr:response regulator [Gammaproteobacteria bacterium]